MPLSAPERGRNWTRKGVAFGRDLTADRGFSDQKLYRVRAPEQL